MLEKLKNITFLNITRFYIIGISSFEGKQNFYLVTIFNSKDTLNIETRETFSSFEMCLKHLVKDFPVLLLYEGENILNKVVENKSGYRKEMIFNAKPEDFYFYEYHQEKEIYSSVVRKNNLDNYLAKLTDLSHLVVHISFGPFVLANLHSLDANCKEVFSSNYSLNINKGNIVDFKNRKASSNISNFIINNEIFNISETPLLACFLDYKYPNQKVEFNSSFLNQNRLEAQYKKRFQTVGIAALLIVLILLFVSHNLQGYYQNTLTEKSSLYTLSLQTNATIKNLKEEKEFKEIILKKSGANSAFFLTQYVSDIGNTVTDDIVLKSINVFSPLKKIRENEEINFESNNIKIIGEVFNDKIFNEWSIKLKTLSWVKKMKIEDYTQDSNSVNSFVINLKI